MSRDYKTPVRNNPKKTANPLIVGLILGILLGLLLAGGTIALFTSLLKPFEHPNVSTVPSSLQSKTTPSSAKPIQGEAEQSDNPKLDFYTILPQKTEMPSSGPSSTGATKQPSISAGITPPTGTALTPTKQLAYLQVGAYKNKDEANNIKIRLALLGIEAKIKTVTLPDGSVWHRVRVGPISSKEKVKALQKLLGKNNIHTTVIKKTLSN
ncbi:MAG: SPOR domain-containing protein [Proteobacteria bacterium]|nr:SPOR domain-containing protein [Pseudomonadota bacterium]